VVGAIQHNTGGIVGPITTYAGQENPRLSSTPDLSLPPSISVRYHGTDYSHAEWTSGREPLLGRASLRQESAELLNMRSEQERIGFLLRTRGPQEAREWVERTVRIYRNAIASRASHASKPEFRRLFEAAIREFEEWLAQHAP